MFKGKIMPPTAAYKCRSLILFACIGELLSLIMPSTIAVSMAAVLEKSEFKAFYCVCGAVCSHEYELMTHVRLRHVALYKVFMHMKYTHLPISALQLRDWVDLKQ